MQAMLTGSHRTPIQHPINNWTGPTECRLHWHMKSIVDQGIPKREDEIAAQRSNSSEDQGRSQSKLATDDNADATNRLKYRKSESEKLLSRHDQHFFSREVNRILG